MIPIDLETIRAAQHRLAGTAVRTPLLPCPWSVARHPDRPLYLKPENLQPVGAFKLRGALNALAQLDTAVLRRGVVTDSSGNHGHALAYAGVRLGVPVTVVVPEDATGAKVAAIRGYGAEVVTVPVAERRPHARRLAEERGLHYLPPFDDPAVVAGQGTVGAEIADDLLAAGVTDPVVLVPVGGGGLAAGVATAVRALLPAATVIGVEPELAADATESFRGGHPVAWEPAATARTAADGLRAPRVGELTWPLLRAHLEEMVTVTEEQITEAVRVLARSARLVAEPSGAVATAAHLFLADRLPAGRVHVAVVSGGNVDPHAYAALLAG